MAVQNLVFTTHNRNKIQEVKQMMPNGLSLLSLSDIDFNEDIQEDQATIAGNASKKARVVNEKTNYSCFSDDTGLEVDALQGDPGVYSARYAGHNASYSDNLDLLLNNLKGISNREARFKTVIALILDGQEYLFEGISEGKILEEKRGETGFGYDPIFLPHGYQETFAQMVPALKNRISHRAKAFSKMINFLAGQY